MTTSGAGTAGVRWDGHSATELAARCDVPAFVLLEETDSTLNVGHELAEGGAVAGTVVLAESQRAGRGRQGRSWSSEPGRGVWCTVIERPRDAAALDVLSIRVGTLAAQALDDLAGERVGVKWPNDLVVRAGKLAGILAEARWSGAALSWVAIGIGVNVQAPPDVVGAAGMPAGVRRADVLAAVVGAVRRAARREGHLDARELKDFHARDILSGRALRSPGRGAASGITSSGALVLRDDSGEQHHRTGTVQFAEES